jgi:hypothetical protein
MSSHLSTSLFFPQTTGNVVPGAFLLTAKTTFQPQGFLPSSVAKNKETIIPLTASYQSAEEQEEQEWEAIIRKPHVRNALRRMATEALRQEAAGETEEGGFALE